MQMKRNGPWGSTLAPQLRKAFLKEPIGEFWGKLRISTTSHGFLVWFWQNNYILANHIHPISPSFTCCTFCWVNYGGARGGGDVTA